MTAIDHFIDIAGLPRWVPYKMVWNPKRKKFDKIPSSGTRNLSTSNPNDWTDVETAAAMVVAAQDKLSGVGFVMTGGVTLDNWTLVGLDFDDVDFFDFKLPFKTYMEKSPSGKGIRAFVWVPTEWAAKHMDTMDAGVRKCAHVEVYFGTSPRFLTVTLDTVDDRDFAKLGDKALAAMESWGLKPYEKPALALDTPIVPGTPLRLASYDLSPDQRHLIDGTGKIDRSAVSQGLFIKLIDNKASKEDILATVMQTPALWAYCLSHRDEKPERALVFAQEEIQRAYAKSNTALRAKLTGYNPDWVKPEPKEVPKRDFPIELYKQAPGLVGEIARWITKASYAPRPGYSYACALAMTSCLIGPYCTHGSRDGKLNLYITLVGETGYGKNEAFDSMIALLNATDAKDCVSDFPASEAGLRRQLNVSPNILIRLDELSHKLDSMKNGGNGSLLAKTILEMYNGARLPSKPYADEKKSLPAVENPFVQIIGGTTDKVWDTVRSSHMEDGTLNRFIFVGLEDAEYAFNPEPDATITKDFKDRLNAFWRGGRMSDLIGYMPPGFGRKVAYSEEVKEALMLLNREAWALQQRDYGSLYTRLVQNTMKIASILAVGDGRMSVEMCDFIQARQFMEWSIAYTCDKIEQRMADSHFERQEKRLMAKLAKEHGKMRMRDAYKFMHISRREMEELVCTLVLGDYLEIVTEDISGTEWLLLK